MMWNLQSHPTTVLNDKVWHFRGSKHTLTPTTYFQGSRPPILPASTSLLNGERASIESFGSHPFVGRWLTVWHSCTLSRSLTVLLCGIVLYTAVVCGWPARPGRDGQLGLCCPGRIYTWPETLIPRQSDVLRPVTTAVRSPSTLHCSRVCAWPQFICLLYSQVPRLSGLTARGELVPPSVTSRMGQTPQRWRRVASTWPFAANVVM